MIFCDVSQDRKFSGGIGNNLFKIAASLSLAKGNDVECKLSTWRYDIFENLEFNNNREDVDILFVHSESDFSFIDIQYSPNMELSGYFQSEKYFEDSKDFIRYCFAPKKMIVEYILNKYSDLIDFNKAASIHVRRGDYLTNSNFNILNMEYYKNSIEKFKKYGINKFIVFSDDILWCRESFLGEDFVFIDGEKDYIDLFLMSMCNYHIIANSSFSWWGAWLNSKYDKKVAYPNEWFCGGLSHLNTKDLVPKEWRHGN